MGSDFSNYKNNDTFSFILLQGAVNILYMHGLYLSNFLPQVLFKLVKGE